MKNSNQKIARLERRETKLVSKGNQAVDEGRNKKADRVLGRAAKVENRLIKAKEIKPKK
jgi:phage shock protein A